MENDKIKQMALYNARHRLMAAREIAEDFRTNTSLGTIIKDYESRIKEIEKLEE